MGISISLCMIVKNEENNLPRCLDSVKDIVDEINIVDTGSTDNTIEVAKRYTDRIYHFDWIDDFSAARNFSFTKATKDYILWLDADDIIAPENREKLIVLKSELPTDTDYVTMMYHYSFDENGSVNTILSRERLVRRERGFIWKRPIHEAIDISGKCIQSDIFITHAYAAEDRGDSSALRNLRILEKVVNEGSPTWMDLYYYGTSLYATGEHDKALDVILRLIDMPNNNSSLEGLAIYLAAHYIYRERGEYEAALSILLDNEHILSDKSEFYCVLGDFYFKIKKQYDLAYESFCKALSCKGCGRFGKFAERNEACYYFAPYKHLGMLCCALKMYKEAVQFLEKALEYDPSNEEVISTLGRLYRILQLSDMINIEAD